MSNKKFKSWWIYLLRGILIILFGASILLKVSSGFENPDAALISLSVYFGGMLFIIGIINIVGALNQGGSKVDWNWLLSEGMLDLMFGLIIMVYPFVTGPIVLLLIGIWGLASAIIQITNALINKEHLKNWKLTVITGIILLFLVYLYLTGDLTKSASMIFYLMGSAMFVLGIMYIILSFSVKEMTPYKVRKMRKEVFKS
jgi:uncharacterized membrane protein HdeD (DUF308 family)